MAPEIAEDLPYNLKADVYSFAMLMFNILSLKRPYEGLDRKKWYELAIVGGRRPSLSSLKNNGVSSDVQNLIKQCWGPNWANRPCFGVIESMLDNVMMKDNCIE